MKLFYYPSSYGTPEEAVDLKGERYASLANAFRYRSEYVDSCKCQPDPWDAASLDRHKAYAEQAKAGKLALYDNREPMKGRRRQILGDGEGPAVITLIDPQFTGESAAASGGGSNFGTTMGITKVGQSASGKSYSAKRKVEAGGLAGRK